MMTEVVGCGEAELRIGMELVVGFREGAVAVPVFRASFAPTPPLPDAPD